MRLTLDLEGVLVCANGQRHQLSADAEPGSYYYYQCAEHAVVPIGNCRRCRLPQVISDLHERGCTWHPRNRAVLHGKAPGARRDRMATNHDEALTTDQALAALRASAFTEPSEWSTCGHPGCTEHRAPGHQLIHCLLGIVGADWNLTDAEALVREAVAVAWVEHPRRHNLAVDARGRTYYFDVREKP